MVGVAALTWVLDLLGLLGFSWAVVRAERAARFWLVLSAGGATLLCGLGWISQLLIELGGGGDWSGFRYATAFLGDQGSRLLLPVVGNGLLPGIAVSLALVGSKTRTRAFLLMATAATGGLALVDAAIFIGSHTPRALFLRALAFDLVGGCIVSLASLLLTWSARSKRLALVGGTVLGAAGLVYWLGVEKPLQQVRLVCQEWGTAQYEYARDNPCCPQQKWVSLDWQGLSWDSFGREYTLEIDEEPGGPVNVPVEKVNVRAVGLFSKGPDLGGFWFGEVYRVELLNRDLGPGRIHVKQPNGNLINVRVTPQEGVQPAVYLSVDAGQPILVSDGYGAPPAVALPAWFERFGVWFGMTARTPGSGFGLHTWSVARLELEPSVGLPRTLAANEPISFSIEDGPKWEWTTSRGGLSRLSPELADYSLRGVAVDVSAATGHFLSVSRSGPGSVSSFRGRWSFVALGHQVGGRGGIGGSTPIRGLSLTGAVGNLRVGASAHALVENDDLSIESASLFIRNRGESGLEVEGRARHAFLNGTDLSSSRWARASSWLMPVLAILAALGGISALIRGGGWLRRKLG